MERVGQIVEEDAHRGCGVVLSACRGVTDALLNLVTAAEQQENSLSDRIEAIRNRHQVIADTLLPGESRSHYLTSLDHDCRNIAGILQTVHLIRSASQTVRDLIAGYGEIWSTRLFSEYLRHRGRRAGKVEWIDAREVVSVEWGALGPAVRWDVSQANMDRVTPHEPATLIITGFIAPDPKRLTTTVGRNGNHFSGSIFGALLNAEEIHIWTDVDGVLSADPRLVPDAQ